MSDELPIINRPDFDYRQDELFSAEPKDFVRCRSCRANKDLSAFTIVRSKNRFGEIIQKRYRICKSCRAKGWRIQYANDAEFKAKTEARQKKYVQEHRTHKQQPHGKLKRLMNNWLGRGRYKLVKQLLGYDEYDLKKHLESLWLPGMNWDNYGNKGWHVDHIRECRCFDLTNIEQFKRCHALKNLRPLWAADNIRRNRIIRFPMGPDKESISNKVPEKNSCHG